MENKEGEGIGMGFYSHSSDPAKTNWLMKSKSRKQVLWKDEIGHDGKEHRKILLKRIIKTK